MSIQRRSSTALIVRQAGQRTYRNQRRAAMAAPIVGENSIGIRRAWCSFHAVMRRSASSSSWGAEIATKFSIDPGNFTLERKFRFKLC